MMWIYLIIGALSVLAGSFLEKQTTKSLEKQLDSALTDIHKLYKELLDKTNELNEARFIIRKLERKNIKLKNLLETTGADMSECSVEGYDLSKIEDVNNHLRTENAGLIRKNKQYQANVKQLQAEINKLTQDSSKASNLKLERYKKEINQLHQAILSKNEIIDEYTRKYGEL